MNTFACFCRVSRIVSCVVALFIAIGTANFLHAQDSTAPPRTLGNAWATVAATHKLTVGYIGGSVTAGTGASKPAVTSWRALTTAWIASQFPDATVSEANATIGGTGCDLGAFRCQQDLLSKHPDLVFIEFAVNNGGPAMRTERSMEGLVRQIWKANPKTDIVFVYCTDSGGVARYKTGRIPDAVQWDQKVADYYGIPSVNVGKALADKLADGTVKFGSLMKDNVHPADGGHKLYADTVIAFLKDHLHDAANTPAALPAPLTKDCLEDGHMVDAWTLEGNGWTQEKKSMANRYPHMLTSDTPGSEITYKFTGSVIGVYWLAAPDGGTLEWSIDGTAGTPTPAYNKYVTTVPMATYVILKDDLPNAPHVLTMKVSDQKEANSKGNWIRIGALLVNGTASQ